MKLFLTFDYEIYFGNNTGTVEKCILYPTELLLEIAEKHGVHFIFFIDSGFIIKLDEYRKTYSQLEHDYISIVKQIRKISSAGHDVQLHIHPHWEDSYYDGEQWKINVNRYKLADFSEKEIADIVFRYKKVLSNIVDTPIHAYRAGGLCVQPFHKLKKAFYENNIYIDSSVFKNGLYHSEQYAYDYRIIPDKDVYTFDDEPTVETEQGRFTEYPISTVKNSPLFFWKLFLLGRINPSFYRPIGDGVAMAAKGYRKKLLTQITYNPLSVDGYNACLLQKTLKIRIRKSATNMVVIGHPKALSYYSLSKLEEFIQHNKNAHLFTTFTSELNK